MEFSLTFRSVMSSLSDIVTSDDDLDLTTSQATWLQFMGRVFSFDGNTLEGFQRSEPERVDGQAGRAEDGTLAATRSADSNNVQARARSRNERQAQTPTGRRGTADCSCLSFR